MGYVLRGLIGKVVFQFLPKFPEDPAKYITI